MVPSQMGKRILQAEGLLRLASVVLAALTAAVVGFNRQTKEVFFSVEKTATVKDLSALWVLTIVASAAAGYEIIQLCKCLFIAWSSEAYSSCSKGRAWACLLLDQGVMYTMFASTAAGAQASLIAVTGVEVLQWTKACNVYTRFCEQIGGGLFCGLVASLAMCALSSISAYRLFKNHYALQHAPPCS